MLDEIPLSRPDIDDTAITAVTEVLRSGRLSMGPAQSSFESLVAERTGRRHGIAVSSGTAGLHLTLLSLGVGPGDEVITTPFSFIASSNAILYTGARPVFVDIDPVSLNMDPAHLEAAIRPRTKAILAVEVFGDPTHMDAYRSIAAQYELPLIEDACEGLGGAIGRTPIGGFGRAAVFGFYPNKQITTGEGGMIVTDDDRLATVCRSLRNHGRPVSMPGAQNAATTTSPFLHERLGYNYRMSELNAALGASQMRRLDEILTKRQRVASRYIERLMAIDALTLPTVRRGVSMSWFVFVVRLSHDYGREERNRIIDGLRRHDIGASDYFPCIHLQPHYRAAFGHGPGDFPIAEAVADRTLALPFYSGLGEREADFVAQTLELMLTREDLSRP